MQLQSYITLNSVLFLLIYHTFFKNILSQLNVLKSKCLFLQLNSTPLFLYRNNNFLIGVVLYIIIPLSDTRDRGLIGALLVINIRCSQTIYQYGHKSLGAD